MGVGVDGTFMPTCPGCGSHWSHQELRLHFYECEVIRRDAPPAFTSRQPAGSVAESLEQALTDHEERLKQLEEELVTDYRV